MKTIAFILLSVFSFVSLMGQDALPAAGGDASGAEPEVIGRKAGEESDDE